MTGTFEGRPTVVGIDGSPTDTEALNWATADARARHAALRIVTMYAWGLRDPWESHYNIEPPELTRAHQAATNLITSTTDRVRSAHPELTVEGVAIEAPAIEGLLKECPHAGTLVLGSRHLDALRATVLGSVSNAVAALATCPVVVVHAATHSAASTEVVVGVDGSDGSDTLIAFAFDFAHDHGLAVRAVLGWWPVIGVLPRSSKPVAGPALAWLEETLSGWRAKYPDVVVHAEVVEDHPAAVLVERSRHQALLVVGSQGHHALTGTLLGSVSQTVLRHAECSVAVVPVHR